MESLFLSYPPKWFSFISKCSSLYNIIKINKSFDKIENTDG